MSNSTYERKGRLFKKSLNSDDSSKFKERTFVLEGDHLFYFKQEKNKDKNFNLIILSSAQIRMLDFDFLSKRNPRPNMPPYLNKQQPYILEIENETRKYVLAAKSLFDLQEWYKAIYAHIETLSDNKNIMKNHQMMTSKEKDISKRD